MQDCAEDILVGNSSRDDYGNDLIVSDPDYDGIGVEIDMDDES